MSKIPKTRLIRVVRIGGITYHAEVRWLGFWWTLGKLYKRMWWLNLFGLSPRANKIEAFASERATFVYNCSTAYSAKRVEKDFLTPFKEKADQVEVTRIVVGKDDPEITNNC